jgi:hypothetical protein
MIQNFRFFSNNCPFLLVGHRVKRLLTDSSVLDDQNRDFGLEVSFFLFRNKNNDTQTSIYIIGCSVCTRQALHSIATYHVYQRRWEMWLYHRATKNRFEKRARIAWRSATRQSTEPPQWIQCFLLQRATLFVYTNRVSIQSSQIDGVQVKLIFFGFLRNARIKQHQKQNAQPRLT